MQAKHLEEIVMTQQAAVSFEDNQDIFSNDQPAVVFNHGMSLRDIEKSVILETLKRQKYNRTKTARVLGIGIRTLQRKLKFYREHDGEVISDFIRF